MQLFSAHSPYLIYALASATAGMLSWAIWKLGGGLLGLNHGRGSTATDGETMLELERMRIAERREIREQYERLAREKMDVLKTAVAMGYGQQQLAELDARLAQHIGDEGLKQLLDSGCQLRVQA